MSEKSNFDFDFNDKYEDIISSMQSKEDKYEDIVSDTTRIGGKHAYEDISSSTSKKHTKWQKNFKLWWKQLTKGKKAALISVTSVILVIAILLGWFFTYFRYNYRSITGDPEELGFTEIKDKHVVNIALFGVDSRDENVFSGNTDSIMILSLNNVTKKVKIISVMRDTFVPVERDGKTYYGKINSVYASGPEQAIKTLNQVFDLDISEYATVNFFGMTDIVNAVGGITATITDDELSWKGYDHPNLNNCMDEICKELGLDAEDYYIHTAGEQTLNGVQAVAYARVRNCTSVWGTRDDYGRTDRQRHVMQELFNKAVTMKKTDYIDLIKALIPCSETSLSYADVLSLAVNILLSSPTFEQYRLPPAEYQKEFLMTGPSGYGSIIYYDINYAARLVNAIIYDDVTIEEYVAENGIDRNDWYSGSTSTNTQKPTQSSSSAQNTQSEQSNSTDQNASENTETVEDIQNTEDIESSQVEEDIQNTEDTENSQVEVDTPSAEDTENSQGDVEAQSAEDIENTQGDEEDVQNAGDIENTQGDEDSQITEDGESTAS